MAEVGGYNPNINKPGVPQKPVNQTGDVAQTGGVKQSQKVQKAVTKGTEQTAQKVAEQKIETIARRMTSRDVVNQLLQIGIRVSNESRALALRMLLMGLELSKENFAKVESLLRGLKSNAFTQQAAIVAISKGIDSNTAVQQLANFLQNNPKLSLQLSQLLNGSANLQGVLANSGGLLSPSLIAQLSAILASLDGFVAAMPIKDKKRKGLFSKSELLTNTRATKALVSGVSKQVEAKSNVENANSLITALGKMAKAAGDVAENLIVQAIMSKPSEREDSAMPDKFSYWQIPNTLTTPPETTELLVLKDKKNKNKTINSKKTKMIFKTNTKELGELAIEVEIEDDELDFRFNTTEEEIRKIIAANQEDLKKRLEKHDYKTKTIRVIKRNLDIKKFLIPTLDLDNLTRVQTEA